MGSIVQQKALRHLAEGLFACWEVPGMQRREPITIAAAAARLRKPEPTVRVWASRHHARRCMKIGKTVYYDWFDLATIERQLRLGLRVPATPEARDEIRAQVRSAA
ncbi:hypothetical protein ABT340_39520 [Streptosporangium sp. NPDC000239]|uniref:hypothetical protein n=1 Tax=Streptosporangium sp. NPDC000239 TaxID=3154248 RepID=UPI00331EAEDD